MKSGVDQVAQGTYTLTGRSQTALLDAPYALTCSFLQESEVQIAAIKLIVESAGNFIYSKNINILTIKPKYKWMINDSTQDLLICG